MGDSSPLFMAGANTVEEQRARWERKRSRTAKELLETEHSYLEQLDLVVTFFVTILKAKGTLKPAVLETIFGPLESIYSASQALSLHLERGNLVLGLENFCQNLELYGHYAENLEQANKTLKEQLRKNKSFRRFKKLQESRPQFQGRELEDLLPLPLQRLCQVAFGERLTSTGELLSPLWFSGLDAFLRFGAYRSCPSLDRSSMDCRVPPLRHHVPFEELGWLHQTENSLTSLVECICRELILSRKYWRGKKKKAAPRYKHFLRDLLENTSPDGAECQKLAKAVKSVSEVSRWVQDIIRRRENSLQLLRVQKLLKGQKTQVLTPGRWYIREGWLLVVPSKGAELKHRMFFLFSDIFIATKPCHPLHLLNSKKLTCQAVYPLHQCVVDKVFGHTKSQGGLLSLSFPHKTLLLMSSDQEDIDDWYRSLTAAVRQLKA